MVGFINNILSSMKNHCKVIGLDYLIILLQLNRLKIIKLMMQTSNFRIGYNKKKFKENLKDVNKQVLETKYTLNLGQVL
jgi:hypothetical protein